MTTPTTAEVGHGSKQEQSMNCTGSPRRAVFMRFKQLAIATVFMGGAAMGHGGVEGDAAAAQLALGPYLHDLRRAFRHATAIYHDTDRLEPNGWARLQETCFEEDAGTTRLGIVFVNPSRIDGVIDPARPEILYYEPQSDGTLRLMGGEYFCPVEACPTPPTLFNQTFRFEEDTNGHALHVWAWLSNPNGLTNPANPNVDTTYCPCLQVEPEPLGEQGTGESGRARQDLTEASTAKMQLADDQRCPTLGEDLGATGDGAVLTVRPHDASVTPPPFDCEVHFLDFSTAVRGGSMWPSRKEGHT